MFDNRCRSLVCYSGISFEGAVYTVDNHLDDMLVGTSVGTRLAVLWYTSLRKKYIPNQPKVSSSRRSDGGIDRFPYICLIRNASNQMTRTIA